MTPAAADHGGDSRPVAAIFDLDRTITRRGTFSPFLLSVARRHPWKFVHLFAIALAALRHRLGAIDRKQLKEVMLGAVLGGAARPAVDGYAAAFVARTVSAGLRPAALAAIAAHRQSGNYLVLATASMDFYAEPLGAALGFDAVVATRSHWHADGRLSGRIDGENCCGAAKLDRIRDDLPRLRADYRLVAYSDHHSDAPLLRWVDRAIAVAPTAKLRAIAAAESFEVADWQSCKTGDSV